MACLQNGRNAKRIATLLSISVRTAENHIRNLMLKIDCRTQQHVLDFIETHKKVTPLNQYYLGLLLQLSFESQLQKVTASNTNTLQALNFTLIYHKDQSNALRFITNFEKILKIVGIHTVLKGLDEKEYSVELLEKLASVNVSEKNKNIIYINENAYFTDLAKINIAKIGGSLFRSNKFSNIMFIGLPLSQHYYFLFFDFLKQFLSPSNIEPFLKIIKKEYPHYHDPRNIINSENPINLKFHIKHSLSKNIRITGVFKKLFWGTIVCCIVILVIGNLHKNTDPPRTFSILNKEAKKKWNLPRQDHQFIGREVLLDELHKKLHEKSNTSAMQSLVISAFAGLGGIGKTQLALQYIHHNTYPYTLRAWFPAENLDQLRHKFIEFAKFLGNKEPTLNSDSAISYCKRWLTENPGWLLIFDNVESYKEISGFLPDSGGYIVLTTRQRNWPNTFKLLPVEVMTEKEAIELVQAITSSAFSWTQSNPREKSKISDLSEVIRLVETVGYLPLAVAQASAYIKQNQISIKQYLELYKNHEQSLLADTTFPGGSHLSIPVSVTWNITLDKLRNESKQRNERFCAVDLLTAAAYFAPEKISRQSLSLWFKEAYPHIKNPSLIVNKAIRELWSYSMINYDEEQFINVHRLVQAILHYQHFSFKNKKDLNPQNLDEWYQPLFKSVHTFFSQKVNPLEDERRKISLLPHLQCLVKNYQKDLEILLKSTPDSHFKPLVYGQVLRDIAEVFYIHLWDAQNAKPYYEDALKIFEDYYGKNHIEVTNLLTNLADAYGTLGDPEKQAQFASQALKIKEQHLGKEHVNLIPTLDSLGAALWALGKSNEGREFLERSLLIGEKNHGYDAVEISETLIYLGNTYGDLNDSDKKLKLLERALAVKQKHYGKDHLQAALPLVSLGVTYQSLGKLQKSKELLEQALAIQEKNYGKEHVEVGETLSNLGNTNLALGDWRLAETQFLFAIKILEEYYDVNHPYVARALHHLSKVYIKIKEYKKAKNILERTLTIKERYYGKNHPQTQSVISDLNSVWQELSIN